MSFTVPTVFTAIDKLTAPVRKMSGAVNSFANKANAGMNRLDRRLNKVIPSFGQMGKQIVALAGTTLLLSGLSGAVGIMMDYEQANANLSAVMNTTSENQQILATDAERLGAITAKSATEVVGLQEAFARLGFETPQIVNMTQATINGSIAMNSELADTAELTGAVVKTFKDFSSIDAPDILDKMTLATQKSALNFEKLQTALPIVGGAANAAGVSFEQTLALLGKLSDAGIDASSSSTALRNIFIESAAKGDSYGQILESIKNNQDKLTAANDEFGKRAAVPAAILSDRLSETAELTEKLTNATTFQGAATKAANERANTLQGSITLLSSAYSGMLLEVSKGTGAMSNFKSIIEFVTDNLTEIFTVAGLVVGVFVALKLAVALGTAATFAYNVVVGVSSVLSATQAASIGASNVAMRAQTIASYVLMAAQWVLAGGISAATSSVLAFSAALLMNPITWVVVGIAALIAVIVLVIAKYDEWGAALSIVLGPLGMIINLVMSFKRNWQMITDAFTNDGVLGGFKAIAVVILDSILMPLQQVFQIMEKIPGLDFGISTEIEKYRNSLGLNVTNLPPQAANAPALNNGGFGSLGATPIDNKTASQKSLEEKITTNNNNLNLNINDPENRTSVDSSSNIPGINISSTLGFQ